MERTIDDALRYVMFVTRHIKRGRVKSAILAVLMDLGFAESLDGFSMVRQAIYLKFGNSLLRFSTIYLMIAEACGMGTDAAQLDVVDKDISKAITGAWELGRIEKWIRVFQPEEGEKFHRPTNGKFIARCACLMELWCDCWEEEESYAG